jgi:hypothetical protein
MKPNARDILYYTAAISTPTSFTLGGVALPATASDWDAGTDLLNDPFLVQNPAGFYELTYSTNFLSMSPPYTGQAIGYATSLNGLPPFHKIAGADLAG